MPPPTSDPSTRLSAPLPADALEQLRRLSEFAAETESADAVAEAALGAMRDVVGIDRCAVLYMQPDGTVRFAASRGLSEAYLAAGNGLMPWEPDDLDPRPVVVEDIEQHALAQDFGDLLVAEAIRSMAFIPIVHRKAIVGRLTLYRSRAGPFEEELIALCRLIASHVAFAIERGALREVAHGRRREEDLHLLANIGLALGRSLDHEQTLRELAELAVPRLGDWCAVYMPDPEGGIRRLALVPANPANRSAAEAVQQHRLNPAAVTGVPRVLRSGESIFEPDVPLDLLVDDVDDREGLARVVAEMGITSWICLPLVARGRTLGAISFMFGESGRRHTEDDFRLAQELARTASLAVDNARLFQLQRQTSRTLERALLPPTLPEVPRVELAAAYRSGEQGLEVGGDFYDVFDAGDWWAIAMGDVCGRGSAAAALTGLARHTIRTAAMREARPSDILLTLNEAMLRSEVDELFCTAVLARVEPGRRGALLTVSRAGHPPALILRADGSTEWLSAGGMLLGIVDDPGLVDERAELAPGDTLVLYTDGVIERREDSETFGEQRLVEAVAAPATSARELVDRIETRLRVFAERGHDDYAILVARATT